MRKFFTCFIVIFATSALAGAAPFKPLDVDALAHKLSRSSYEAPPQVSTALQNLNYEQHSSIRFKPDNALWKKEKLPFQVQFFFPGSYFHSTVQVFSVKSGQATEVPFSLGAFTLGSSVPPIAGADTKNLGFAGFRVHYQLNKPGVMDDLISFLGASYFRSMGRNEGYGLSARGLAVDTAESSGEEFPAFRKFWIETPAPDAKQIVIHALLDSPSVTGAYHFIVRPGDITHVDVTATLFTRKAITRLGEAPLTSMYLFGENHRGPATDFHPEDHDSDGLLIWDGTGERLWRPLNNPARLQVSSFQSRHPRGFGLIQRDKSFASYEDLDMKYENRTSVWVEPLTGFDEGAITLVEIPSPADTNDNIGAFWVPQKPVEAGQKLEYSYRLNWGPSPAPVQPVSEVHDTHVAAPSSPNRGRFVIDFTERKAGGKVTDAPVEPAITLSRGRLLNAKVEPNPNVKGWRVTFEFEAEGSDPVEMRCFLKQGQEALSETWSYLWTH